MVSNSVRPHRQQPTRLPRPWDSPGKNTGVGCHLLLQCMKVKSESELRSPKSSNLHARFFITIHLPLIALYIEDHSFWSADLLSLLCSLTENKEVLCYQVVYTRRRKWQPTPVFLPGESQGRWSLVGCRLWDHTESDKTEATWQQQHNIIFIFLKYKNILYILSYIFVI